MKRAILPLAALLIAAILAGCAAEQYGAGVNTSTPRVKVKDIFFDQSMVGRTVTVEGIISSQCGSNGCWFVLQDDTGQIFVNLAPNNMSVPPRMQKKATVTGQVALVQNELQVIAHGVAVR